MTAIDGKRIVLGVSGGISAYKAIEVCRRLVDAGAHVVPIMTENAKKFVGPNTFSALASEPVHDDLFEDWQGPIPHTRLGQEADLILVCPATARVIGSYVAGISDDILTNTLIATRAPVVVCPAMHTEMWEHPAIEANIATLRERGVHIVAPEEGRLAGGDIGKGRLAAPATIVDFVAEVLDPFELDLTGLRVMVTAGGTREALDPVRFIGNRSTGKQGYAFAEAAARAGAEVELITTVRTEPAATGATSGPGSINVTRVATAAEMHTAAVAIAESSDVVVMAAAVADFRPKETSETKIKKGDGVPRIELERTVDILADLGSRKRPGQQLVGFAAETNDLIANAERKLEKKNADFIVANDVSAPGTGFAHDTNAVTILAPGGVRDSLALASKFEIARAVLRTVVAARTPSD
ncbi:MAG: bifunctional phosphopantothenoylcysteine decarboxylase/phosphopantothenate--cysteine ligase CoaBC [Actinomycetota bacterium]